MIEGKLSRHTGMLGSLGRMMRIAVPFLVFLISGTFTLLVVSTPILGNHLEQGELKAISVAGFFISILLALMSWILVRGQTRSAEMAGSLRHELAERKRMEADMRLAEKVFENVDTAVLVTDASARIIRVNPAFTAITGYTAAEAIGNDTSLLSSGAHPAEFYAAMWKSLNETGGWQGEIFNRKKNGEFYTEWLSINEVRDDEGRVTNYVALFSDISDRKAAEEEMISLAHYDGLTGLPNRTLFSDRLQQAIMSAKRSKSHMAVMFVDLDHFKPINDTMGHHIGDIVLKDVARRVLACIRESDTAARVGGDEFVVLLPHLEDDEDAMAVAEKIRCSLEEVFVVGTRKLNISSSIGVAVYPEHGKDEKTLLKHADAAMYHSKEAGRNRISLFNDGMRKA